MPVPLNWLPRICRTLSWQMKGCRHSQPFQMAVGPVGVAAPAEPLLEEGPALVREHGQRACIGLVDGLVARGQYEPGQPAVVPGYTPAAEEELVLQMLEHRQHHIPPVCRRPAG